MPAWLASVSVPPWLALKALGRGRPALYFQGSPATVRLAGVARF